MGIEHSRALTLVRGLFVYQKKKKSQPTNQPKKPRYLKQFKFVASQKLLQRNLTPGYVWGELHVSLFPCSNGTIKLSKFSNSPEHR
jgi:hypothetical protein